MPVVMVAAAALLSGLSVLALGAAAGPGKGPPPQDNLLRLGDVGRGYFFLRSGGEEGPPPPKVTCDPLRPADPEPPLAAFLRSYPSRGCYAAYARIFKVPGNRFQEEVAGSGALRTGSAAAASAGLAVAPLLLAHLFNDRPREAKPPGQVGDNTRLFRWKNVPIVSRKHRDASLIAWRSGRTLAAVLVQGGSPRADDRGALRLARLQQQRIRHPTPYTLAQRYDREALLEDPTIAVPVYWLRRKLNPRHALPIIRLRGGGKPLAQAGLPEEKLSVYYTHGLQLNSWDAAGWNRFAATPEGSQMISWHCTQSTEIPLARGTATIYAAYARDFANCPATPPRRHFAIVRLGETVIAVDFVSCETCEQVRYGGPFNSTVGMEAVAYNLRRWHRLR